VKVWESGYVELLVASAADMDGPVKILQVVEVRVAPPIKGAFGKVKKGRERREGKGERREKGGKGEREERAKRGKGEKRETRD